MLARCGNALSRCELMLALSEVPGDLERERNTKNSFLTFSFPGHLLAVSIRPRSRRGIAVRYASVLESRKESPVGTRKNRSRHRTGQGPGGSMAKWRQGTLRSYSVGALPIINRILERMCLEEILAAHFRARMPAPRFPRVGASCS